MLPSSLSAIRVEGGRVRGVETAEGFVACEKLVIACGQWSREVGRRHDTAGLVVNSDGPYIPIHRVREIGCMGAVGASATKEATGLRLTLGSG